MFSIFRKKNEGQIDFSALYCDMHSHLIPNIDDGSPNLETSIQLIQGMMDMGYKKIITTPHIMWDMYQITPEIIQSGCELVQEELERKNMDVEFSAAAEYYMDDHFSKMLENNEPLLTLKDHLILVEISFIEAPADFKQTILFHFG